MRVLSLTHAHLNPEGLSPVSCERVDSITGTWGGRLNWQVDVIHTKGSKWRGIWPGGKGMKINIFETAAPEALLKEKPRFFNAEIKQLLSKKQAGAVVSLVSQRIKNRIRAELVKKGFLFQNDLVIAEKWGDYLASLHTFNSVKYDFVFVSVGYGDEYLLQTALTISKKFGLPMVVDFRDLWSDHHDPTRFIPRQKQLIRKFEKKLLERTALISAPQKHMITLLKKWAHVPLYHLPHSAYVGKDWEDGKVVNNEFRMLYAGKLYSNGPGITMLLDLIKKMSKIALPRPFKCHFFVDEADTLKKLAIENGISDNIVINEWVSPWQLWKNLRSAHLLVVIDSATEENYPILLTKTFQYAYSGQQLLCLQKYENKEMHEFLQNHHAGMVSTSTSEAAAWISSLAADLNIYETLPPLRSTIAQREDVAEAYGKEIKNILNKQIHKEL